MVFFLKSVFSPGDGWGRGLALRADKPRHKSEAKRDGREIGTSGDIRRASVIVDYEYPAP